VDELTGLRKAAILMVQLGQENASKVLGAMHEGEMEELVAEIARLQNVEAHVADAVVEEFVETATARRYVSQGGLGYARELLEEGLGSERAREVMGRLEAAISEMPFQFLRRTDARQLLSFLQDEHPQTIALVLAHLSAEQASQVLSNLNPGLQGDVAHRIASMDRTSPDIVRKVEQNLQRRMSSVLQPAELSTVGGLEPLVEIINRSDRPTERLILDALEALDAGLAEQVRSMMFLFEDIVTLDDRSVQTLLREVDTVELATAIKGVRADVRDKVLSNLSTRAAQNLTEEIELLGPVRISAVEEAQANIVRIIRQQEESGQIVVRRGDDDQFVA
ncbi:MAG: flagellar motor switch protein FliG, partial [Candidatus Nanopelagicales bacterium]